MMSPAGFDHGWFVANITAALQNFIKKHSLGVVTGAETGYFIARTPDTVRAPDVGYIHNSHVPEGPIPGYFPGAPDLAVEVLSPNDRANEVAAKVETWLRSGCCSVWVVDPTETSVTIHRSNEPITVFHKTEQLTDNDLLPGFSLPVADIFAR